MTSKEFRYWFSGLASVKACFDIHMHGQPIVIIRIKTVDRALLDHIDQYIDGSISDQAGGYSQWRAATDDGTLNVLIEIFDKVPMLTKKQQDFDVWRKVAEKRIAGTLTDRQVEQARDRLQLKRAKRMLTS